MLRNKYTKTILAFVLLFSICIVKAQEISEWQHLSSPLFSNFKKIQFIAADTAFISGKQLLILNGEQCEKFPHQPPHEISKMFAVNSNSIFVSNNMPYQNSDLFLWNGKKWEEIYNPMANNIMDMFFIDSRNGVLVAYGEIAQMIDGKWHHINPPTNRNFSKVIQINKDKIVVLTFGKGMYQFSVDKWIAIKKSIEVHHLSFVDNEIYAIGNDFLGIIQSDSIIKLSKDKIWSRITSVSKTSKGNLIGVGEQGKIVRLSNEVLSYDVSPTNQNLHQLINYNDALWCVGDEGTILKYTHKKIKYKPHLWKGFEIITFNPNAKLKDDEYGVIAADFNNDGWTDIFTSGLFEQENLYINQKGFSFLDQTKTYHLDGSKNNTSEELNLGACAGDIDNDGYIDLYLGVLNGKNKIYKNIKGKYFVDYSYNTGGIGEPSDRTNACIMGDIDNDGDLDVFITNEYSTNRLFLNNGVGIFTEITKEVGLETVEGGNSATFGDIDQDGDIDLYVTNWSAQNILYQNQYIETGEIYFKNKTQKSQTGGKNFTKSNACIFSDLDNDGDLDLFVTNRKTSNRLYINDGTGVFDDQTKALIGLDTDSSYGAVIADFDGDSFKDIYVSNVGNNVFYKNNKGNFLKQTTKYGAVIKGYSTGSAVSDFDNDGDLDIYIANYVGASSALLRNKKNDKQHITLQLSGLQNNSNAIGVKIYVYAENAFDKSSELLWFDEIRAGSGYVSENDFKKVIPIQKNDIVAVKIVYPNGIIKNIKSVAKGSLVKISDTDGFQKTLFVAKRVLKKWLYDPHYLFELVKWLFVILLITITGFVLQKKHRWKPVYPIIGGLLFILFYFIQYKSFEFKPILYSSVLPLTSILTGVLLLYYFFERQYIKRIAIKEQKKIKTKLSRDLHDNLASTISAIGIYLTLIRYKLTGKQDKIKALISDTETMVGTAADSITDLIWAINPEPETLTNLLMRINKNFSGVFREKNIEFRIDNQCKNDTKTLEPISKQNLFLIIKEVLNNILKYAEATVVSIIVVKKGKKIHISISDNGIGFDYKQVKNQGHGFRNMKQRAEEIKASLKLESEKGKGSSCTIVLDKI